MTLTTPTVEEIEALSSGQVARVVDVFEQVEETQSFMSGMGTLSHLIDHDDPTATALDNAAKKHEGDTVQLLYAVRWAYQANLHSDSLGSNQIEALTAPWSARN